MPFNCEPKQAFSPLTASVGVICHSNRKVNTLGILFMFPNTLICIGSSENATVYQCKESDQIVRYAGKEN